MKKIRQFQANPNTEFQKLNSISYMDASMSHTSDGAILLPYLNRFLQICTIANGAMVLPYLNRFNEGQELKCVCRALYIVRQAESSMLHIIRRIPKLRIPYTIHRSLTDGAGHPSAPSVESVLAQYPCVLKMYMSLCRCRSPEVSCGCLSTLLMTMRV